MKTGTVRIIGGKWRSRRLRIAEIPDLRPTPDRVRETVFNWLSSIIHGAYCLDLFSGTGAFGFEALSRGAAQVVMVDQSQEIIHLLQSEIKKFDAGNAIAYPANIPEQLQPTSHLFDIVFIDPPYQRNLLLPTCHYLESHHFLADIAYIYLEHHSIISDNELPAHWHLLKQQQAGAVAYHLAKRDINT